MSSTPEKDLGWRTAVAVVSGLVMVGGLHLATGDDTDHRGWKVMSTDTVEIDTVETISHALDTVKPANVMEDDVRTMMANSGRRHSTDYILAMMISMQTSNQ